MSETPRPPKQEQEPASDDVVEVAPGVLRLQLPIMFTGLGHVNMYVFVDDDGIAVVDPGLPGPDTWRWIVDRLERAERSVTDVHTVVITHSHPDHFGGAARLAAEADARIVAHAGFRVPWLVDTWPDVIEIDDIGFPIGLPNPDGTPRFGGHVHHGPGDPDPRWIGQAPWSADMSFMPPPAEVDKIRAERDSGDLSFASPVPHVRLDDGDRISLAGRDWFAIHTPGHTEDHLCLYDPTEGVLLTGDHVLPSITPHISGMCSTETHDPLDGFVDALARVRDIPAGLALPAHGHPFADIAGRVDAIVAHHDRRLAQLFAIAADLGRPGTVNEFTEAMFPPRHWGLMAESEVYAHLEHLRHRGAASRARDGAELTYRITATEPPTVGTDEGRAA